MYAKGDLPSRQFGKSTRHEPLFFSKRMPSGVHEFSKISPTLISCSRREDNSLAGTVDHLLPQRWRYKVVPMLEICVATSQLVTFIAYILFFPVWKTHDGQRSLSGENTPAYIFGINGLSSSEI